MCYNNPVALNTISNLFLINMDTNMKLLTFYSVFFIFEQFHA